MFGQTARAALKIAESASADLSKHVAVCNELQRQAQDDRRQIRESVEEVSKDLTGINANLQGQLKELKGLLWKLMVGVGGGAFMVILGAFSALAMFILEHIDKLLVAAK